MLMLNVKLSGEHECSDHVKDVFFPCDQLRSLFFFGDGEGGNDLT